MAEEDHKGFWEKREKLKMEHHEPDDTVKKNLIDIIIRKSTSYWKQKGICLKMDQHILD